MSKTNKDATISKEMLHVSIERGNALRRKSDAIAIAFRGFDSPSYDINVHQQILEEYLNYEREVPDLLVMKVVYGDIARSYLNVQDFKNALKYAVAYFKINENEPEGKMAAYQILADIAIATNNHRLGADYFVNAYPNMGKDQKLVLAQLLEYEQKSKENGDKPLLEIPADFAKVELPETFHFLGKSEAATEERTIRSYMFLLQCSRKEATAHVRSKK